MAHDIPTPADSQYRMELDIFLPSKDIAFEYHGEQHYKWHYLSGDPTAVQKRDQAKRDTCKAAGTFLRHWLIDHYRNNSHRGSFLVGQEY